MLTVESCEFEKKTANERKYVSLSFFMCLCLLTHIFISNIFICKLHIFETLKKGFYSILKNCVRLLKVLFSLK